MRTRLAELKSTVEWSRPEPNHWVVGGFLVHRQLGVYVIRDPRTATVMDMVGSLVEVFEYAANPKGS